MENSEIVVRIFDELVSYYNFCNGDSVYSWGRSRDEVRRVVLFAEDESEIVTGLMDRICRSDVLDELRVEHIPRSAFVYDNFGRRLNVDGFDKGDYFLDLGELRKHYEMVEELERKRGVERLAN